MSLPKKYRHIHVAIVFITHLCYINNSYVPLGGRRVHIFLIVLLVIDCLALIAVVLLQSGKSEGLSGAISGGAEQLFGKQKARGMDLVLQRITIVLSIIFFVLTILLAYFGY